MHFQKCILGNDHINVSDDELIADLKREIESMKNELKSKESHVFSSFIMNKYLNKFIV